ncbi:MAG TPA: CDP-alcohol phosphatidyltransferase family protein [Gemmatimonadaceae bacterium]|nr:CDP-alcohol phosphatidyltransferase family protein [Gemmatimonadaceae bacterium]
MTATTFERRVPASAASMLHASNLLTYASLLAGLSVMIAASWYHSRSIAGMGIALIVVLDTFDGRFARRFVRTPVERQFGVQLDSLADAINSGIVPVVVTLSLLPAMSISASAAWIAAAFIYVIGVVTRLGYYNITHDEGQFFVGLPAPVAALIVATMLLWPVASLSASILMSSAGLAMISPMRIPRPSGFGLFLFVLWPVVVFAFHVYEHL